MARTGDSPPTSALAVNVNDQFDLLALARAALSVGVAPVALVSRRAVSHCGGSCLAAAIEAARQVCPALSAHFDHLASTDHLVTALGQRELASVVNGVVLDANAIRSAEEVDTISRTLSSSGHALEVEVEVETGPSDFPDSPSDWAISVLTKRGAQVRRLAVPVGSVHSFGPASLDFHKLSAFRRTTDLELVIHGGESLSLSDIRLCISDFGPSRVNIGPIVRVAMSRSLAHHLTADNGRDYRSSLSYARDSLSERLEALLTAVHAPLTTETPSDVLEWWAALQLIGSGVGGPGFPVPGT